MLPCDGVALGRYCTAYVMDSHGPVAAIKYFIFTRPHHFYHAARHLFGNIRGIYHIITRAGTTTKTAPGIQRIDFYLPRFDTSSRRNLLLIYGWHLAGEPEFAIIFLYFN